MTSFFRIETIWGLIAIPLLLIANYVIHKNRTRFHDFYLEFMKRSYPYLFALFFVITIVLGYFAFQIKVKSDFIELLPPETPSVSIYNKVRHDVGGTGFLILAVEGYDTNANLYNVDPSKPDEMFNKKIIDFVTTLSKRIDSFTNMRYVLYKLDTSFVSFIKENQYLYIDLEDLEEIRKRVKDHIDFEIRSRNPLYVDFMNEEHELNVDDIKDKYMQGTAESKQVYTPYFYSKDKSIIVIMTKPGDVKGYDKSRALLDKVEEEVAAVQKEMGFTEGEMKISMTGFYKIMLEDMDLLTEDLRATTVLAAILILLTILLFFRNIRSVLLVIVPMVASVIWMVGFAQLTLTYFNVITGFTMCILLGLSIDFAIHLIARYREERRRGKEVFDALHVVMVSTGDATITAALTTTAAFYALLFTSFKGFSEFGFVGGSGMLFALIAMFVFLPALIIISEKIRPMRVKQISHEELQQYTRTHQHFIRPKVVFVTVSIFIVVMLISAVIFPGVKFEFDFNKMRGRKNKAIETEKKLLKITDLVGSPAVIIAEANDRFTPLIAACMNGHVEAVRILVDAGADVNGKDEEGFTPLDHAHMAFKGRKGALKRDDYKAIIAFLESKNAQRGYDEPPYRNAMIEGEGDHSPARLSKELIAAAKEGDVDEVVRLVDAGADVNRKDEDAFTPLDHAYMALKSKKGVLKGDDYKAIIEFLESKNAQRGGDK